MHHSNIAQSDFLPATHPSLPDINSCEAWLAAASMGDSRQACAAFIALLGELEESPPRHATYLQILERVRPLVVNALEEHAKRFSGKALPLAHAENLALQQSSDLCRGMMHAYRRLLRAATRSADVPAAARELVPHIALLAARAVEFAALPIMLCYRARHAVANPLWLRLHEGYALAERLGVAETRIAGSERDPSRTESCVSFYVRPLLFALAHPYGLPARESLWVAGWVRRWSPKISIRGTLEKPHGYGMDIRGSSGPRWMAVADAAGQDHMRFLDAAALRYSLKKRLHLLETGRSPADAGLGRDCVQPAAGELLKSLRHTWCDAVPTQRFPRHPSTAGSASVEAAVGIAATHAALSGKPFESEVTVWDYARRGAAYPQGQGGAVVMPAIQSAATPGAAIETWVALDESAVGFRLRRPGPGARMAHRQLMAVRPRGASQFILSEVRWLAQEVDLSVTIGTRALPGLATPCAIRPVAADPTRPAAFSQAFLLSVARSLPTSLVLPFGWYQPGRTLELRVHSGILRIILSGLAGRGYDYERATFSATG